MLLAGRVTESAIWFLDGQQPLQPLPCLVEQVGHAVPGFRDADGRHSLLDMAIIADVPFARIEAAARLALEASLVRLVTPA